MVKATLQSPGQSSDFHPHPLPGNAHSVHFQAGGFGKSLRLRGLSTDLEGEGGERAGGGGRESPGVARGWGRTSGDQRDKSFQHNFQPPPPPPQT